MEAPSMYDSPFDKSAATWDEKLGRQELAEAIGRAVLQDVF